MSTRTHRLLGLAAWVVLFGFFYVIRPSTVRGMHLFASMLAWSLVGLAFGVSWFKGRSWLESTIPFDDAHTVRRFKLAQSGAWMGTVIALLWVVDVADASDAGWMALLTLFFVPIWFGVRNVLEPRSAQPTV